MSQSSQHVPAVTANLAGTHRQVNLRDYLNQRVAPFLKEAIHKSLDSEAEFPLQWLGEQLIQQSILYEGNPDSTNIRERFVYKHDQPPKQAVQPAAPVNPVSSSAAPAGSSLSPMPEGGQSTPDISIVNGSASAPHTASGVNGTSELPATTESASRDTEMGGTT